MGLHRLFCLCAATAIAWAAPPSGVKVREQRTNIPTYAAGPAEPSPMFYFGRQSQGAQAPVYPYPMWDVLTQKKVDRTYTLVYLENEYLRIGILPELGGRIFEGLDKTNNYDFIYRQHVIKPALIGIIGAWVSGGVEWNLPHHHRASTFMPVQYKTEEHADGSKTVWVGELELRHRMRWAVGYTLRPGKSYLEASLRILNRTPEVNTMLCFANVAVHTNDNYQVIFPPTTQWGTGHSKRAFQKWPVSDMPDGGKLDVSLLKNHIPSTSIFAWNYDDDFFAGYDHGKQAGTMSIADHNIVPGKKFFTWGKGPGQIWDKTLTDDDGPYIELMVGAYSDNQPDYSWLEPYEGRSFSINWYPFRNIGGVKRANLEAAVNLDVEKGVAKVGFYATSAHKAARVTVKAGARTLLEETIAIDPGKPYRKEVAVPAGMDPHDIVATLSAGGKELVSYSPVRLQPEPMPKPVTPPAPPAEIKSAEELYLTGLRATQFHDPSINPEPYWEEALRRDPSDSRVNTALGIRRLKHARYADAEKHFRRAIERIADRYTSPKDGEPLYYLGVTLQAQGKLDEAYTYFYKAAWSQGWKAAAYYGLAEIASTRGNMSAALEFAGRSIDSNALNIRAQNLKAAALRHLGRPREALQVLASAAHGIDPLDVRSMAERWLAMRAATDAKTLRSTLYEHPGAAQEVAAEYLNAGLWQDGLAALAQVTDNAPDAAKLNPVVCYYLAYFAAKLGQGDKAAAYGKQARMLAPDYVFPFQREAIDVLASAAKADPKDARARYYLGNLLFDWQPERAATLWEESAALDPSFAMVHRNLATAYLHRKPAPDLKRAIAELERAVACERKYPLHFAELGDVYEQAAIPLEKRWPLFERNASVVAMRDDTLNRSIATMVGLGRYDDAIRAMSSKKFALAEGANLNVSEHWTAAHLLRGRSRLTAGQSKLALQDFETAVTIPANLPASYAGGARANAEAAYWTGLAYEGLGDRAKAAASWTKGAAAAPGAGGRRGGAGSGGFTGGGAQSYWQALCTRKLGDATKAKGMFQELVSSGQRLMEPAPPAAGGGGRGRAMSPRARSALAHYTTGLGYLGLDDTTRAKAEFAQSLELNPDLLGARTALASIR